MVMPEKNWKTDPLKVRILNLRSRKFFVAIYNPQSLQVTETTDWSEIKVPGVDNPYYQFSTAGAMNIPMQFFINEFGEGKQYEGGYVEESIQFFREAMTPKPINYGGRIIKTAPDILRMFWGRIKFGEPSPGVNVILTSMRTDRMMFQKEDGTAIRATLDLEFKKFKAV